MTPIEHLRIRWMLKRDTEQVLAIERCAFRDFPWLEGDFNLAARAGAVAKVAVDEDDDVLGYMVYEVANKRPRQLVILNLAVHGACRRLGVGRALVANLRDARGEHRCAVLAADVRETNLAGQLFLRSLGFSATRVMRDRYEDVREDAFRMVLQPEAPAIRAELLRAFSQKTQTEDRRP